MTSPSQPAQPNPRNILLLKIIVVFFGVILVVLAITFVILMVTVGPKSSRVAKTEAAPVATQKMVDIEERSMAVPDISLEETENVTHMALDGGTVILHVEGENGARVVMVNLHTGDHETVINITK